MVAEVLGRADDRLDEVDRADEVAAVELAQDRVAVAGPAVEIRQPLLDLARPRAPSI